jgi:hypothetical protein
VPASKKLIFIVFHSQRSDCTARAREQAHRSLFRIEEFEPLRAAVEDITNARAALENFN